MLDRAHNYFSPDELSDTLTFHIPEQALGTLINMVAIAVWNICGGHWVSNQGLRSEVKSLEQILYEQSYRIGGADAVWKDPEDGSYHHPTFPEQDGEAWRAIEEFEEECFKMKLIEISSRILAERDAAQGEIQAEGLQRHEHLLQDIFEVEGAEGLMRALIGGSTQPNS